MAGIFGKLGLADTDRVFNATVGQQAIYDAAVEYVNKVNAEIDRALSCFVAETTSDYKRRFKLPGGGHLSRRGPDGRFGAAKAYGSWDVAFPLEDYGREIAGDDVSMAYMTARELENHILTVTAQNVNTVRYEMLKALFNNAQDSFTDPLWGSLSIEPLANGDSVVYPPVKGSEAEATDDHYRESGYTVANISDTNDPYVTIVDELEEHFGGDAKGENIVVFINNDSRAKSEALTNFVDVPDSFIRVGQDTDVPTGLPNVPGKLIGRHAHGCWVSEWRWIPATYMLGIYLGAPAPLIRRVDPQDTGLWKGGIALVTEDVEFPFRSSTWRHRFGFGCGNRLNGYVLEVAAGGSYTIPSAYA